MKSSSPIRSTAAELEFLFGDFRLASDGILTRGGEEIHLAPKELAALRLLLHHAGQVVTRTQLKQALWGDVHVTPDSVPRCLSSLRARLEPEDRIQTVYKRGYRLIGIVLPQGEPAPAAFRVVIMPFSAGQSVEQHLGAAIAEEVTAQLTTPGHAGFSVLARDSVFTLAAAGHTAAKVGELLRADLVLTGTVLATVSHYRLRAEMIRVQDGTQIWVEDFLVPRSRIIDLKLELAARLVVRIGEKFLPKPRPGAKQGEGQQPDSARQDAYETFMRVHHEWQSLDRHRMTDAMQKLLVATELDPALLAARIDLAQVILAQELCGFMPPRVAADRIRSAVRPVLDASDEVTALLPPLGWVAFHVDRDLAAALELFSQSAHLPHDPWITRLRVMLALSRHRFGEALQWLESALPLDPYAPWLRARLAWTCHLAGKEDRSMGYLEEALRLFPEHESTQLYGSILLAHSGDTRRAEKMAADLVRRAPYFDIAVAIHAYALARAGRESESRQILERLQWLSRERFVLSSFSAAAYAALGDVESALSELRSADNSRCPWFFQMLADSRLKPLNGHPEFERMKSRLAQMESVDAELPELQA